MDRLRHLRDWASGGDPRPLDKRNPTGREIVVGYAALLVVGAVLWPLWCFFPGLAGVLAVAPLMGFVGLTMAATFFRLTRWQSNVGLALLGLACVAYVVRVAPHVPGTTSTAFVVVVAWLALCLLAGPLRPVDVTEPGDMRVTVVDFGPRPVLVEMETRQVGTELPKLGAPRGTWHAAVNVSETAAEELASRMRRRGATVEVHRMV